MEVVMDVAGPKPLEPDAEHVTEPDSDSRAFRMARFRQALAKLAPPEPPTAAKVAQKQADRECARDGREKIRERFTQVVTRVTGDTPQEGARILKRERRANQDAETSDDFGQDF
jgi:hypothetical protein